MTSCNSDDELFNEDWIEAIKEENKEYEEFFVTNNDFIYIIDKTRV